MEFDVEERLRFWNAMRPWFSQHGYHLDIHFNIKERCIYSYPQREFKGVEELPYAYLGGDTPGKDPDFASSLSHVTFALLIRDIRV